MTEKAKPCAKCAEREEQAEKARRSFALQAVMWIAFGLVLLLLSLGPVKHDD